jgi:glucan 1,3-beta-glucosidase
MQSEQLRGVNLGGWLVLERWMTPSLFNGLNAKDEYGFCVELGDAKYERLQRHHDSFIKKSDIKWLTNKGINALRIPVGHWIFDGQEPYVPAIKYLDTVIQWAAEYNMRVLIDFHAAPGSQNGQDHSGKVGPIEWHQHPENMSRSLDVIEQLAKRYGSQKSLYGIELLNEPHRKIPFPVLVAFYKAAYERVRKHCDHTVAVVISDAFRPLRKWHEVMADPEYHNVVLDTHLYQAFGRWQRWYRLRCHLKQSNRWRRRLARFSNPQSIIVGEWSLGVASRAYNSLSDAKSLAAHQAYARSQLEAFKPATGQFFWNYKTETPDEWNFRSCYEKGYFI